MVKNCKESGQQIDSSSRTTCSWVLRCVFDTMSVRVCGAQLRVPCLSPSFLLCVRLPLVPPSHKAVREPNEGGRGGLITSFALEFYTLEVGVSPYCDWTMTITKDWPWSGSSNVSIAVQGSYRVLLKSTCAFFTLVTFLPVFFWLVLFCVFLAKMCFSSWWTSYLFLGKYYFSEGFGHKEAKSLSKFVILHWFLWKKFQPCFARHKVHSLCVPISICTFRCDKNITEIMTKLRKFHNDHWKNIHMYLKFMLKSAFFFFLQKSAFFMILCFLFAVFFSAKRCTTPDCISVNPYMKGSLVSAFHQWR